MKTAREMQSLRECEIMAVYVIHSRPDIDPTSFLDIWCEQFDEIT